MIKKKCDGDINIFCVRVSCENTVNANQQIKICNLQLKIVKTKNKPQIAHSNLQITRAIPSLNFFLGYILFSCGSCCFQKPLR